MSSLAEFRVDVRPGGGKIVVDGTDISRQVAAVRIEARAHEIPRLVVELVAGGTVEGVGEVLAVTGGIAEFLSRIDAGELETAALARLDGFGDVTATRAMLDVLIEWAGGGR